MINGNDISNNAMEQLPPSFVVNVLDDGTLIVTRKIWKSLLLELLLAVGAGIGGYLMLHVALRLALLLFVIAVFILAGMWMNVQKLEFSISDRIFSYRSGPSGGRIATEDIVTLDANQLGDNAKSFALIAVDKEGKSHNLFRYLDENEAKALLKWIVQRIGEER